MFVVRDETGREHEVHPPLTGAPRCSGAELNFPTAGRSVCFQSSPAQVIELAQGGITFRLDNLDDQSWTVGFCQAGELAQWMRQ